MADHSHGHGHGSGNGKQPGEHGDGHDHHHYILPDRTALAVGVALLVLTGVTVWVAGIDFGSFNLLVALAVATVKGLLVCLFFMNLLFDRRENSVIFGTSFLFLAIFIVLMGSDVFFRGDVYVKDFAGGKAKLLRPASSMGGAPKFKQAWVSTPELLAHGKELFANQCSSCHGAQGLGNGPAAGSLNPKPRNFAATEGWKNGRKLSDVYKTLTNGVGGMPAFGSLPMDDRFALAHVVQSYFTASAPATSDADLAAVGVNTKDASGGAQQQKTVPLNIILDQMAREAGEG